MDTFEKRLLFITAVSVGLLLLVGAIGLYDLTFVKPIASDNANDYCKGLGFDQYKEFTRVGILSKNPIGVKCEYVERYTDLGVRTTG